MNLSPVRDLQKFLFFHNNTIINISYLIFIQKLPILMLYIPLTMLQMACNIFF